MPSYKNERLSSSIFSTFQKLIVNMRKSSKLWLQFLMIFLISIKTIRMEPAWYKASDGKRYLIDIDKKV